MHPHACTFGQSYTLCFNLVFYATLWWGYYSRSFAVWKGVAVHVVPFWVISQYLMWFTHFWRKCGAPLPLAILGDVLLHWLLLVVMLRHIRRHEAPAWSGMMLVVGVAAAYSIVGDAATGGRLRTMYDVPLATVLAIYLPLLPLSYLAIRTVKSVEH
jgi:hypothetical protein